MNEDDKVVLFPLKSSGQFYVAAVDSRSCRQSTVDSAARVYRWPELVRVHGNQDTQRWSVDPFVCQGDVCECASE